MISIEFILLFVSLGAVIGFIAGLLGVGGGGVLVPILTTIFISSGIDDLSAVKLSLGTSMASVIIISFSSFKAHIKNNNIDWPIAKVMTLGVMASTYLASLVVAALDSTYLAIFFTIFMAYTALKMLNKKVTSSKTGEISKIRLLLASQVIGFISTLVSIGGGSLTVPFLVSKGIEIKKAIGTSAFLGIPISLFATIGFLINNQNASYSLDYVVGYVYLPAVILISIPSLFTTHYGASLTSYLPASLIKKLFAFLLIALSIKMLLILYVFD